MGRKIFCVQKSCQLRIKDDGRLKTDFRNTKKNKEIRKKKKQVIQRNLSKNSFLDGKTLKKKKEKKENSFLIIR